MTVWDLIKRLEDLPPNAEVRVLENDGSDTRHENFWLVDVEHQHSDKEFDIQDEVVLIGVE